MLTRYEDAPLLRAGEVLVTHSTDPAWTPLYARAAGLVLELGSQLSHGAVVAREYRIPAVANVMGATRRLRTGDELMLDGHSGTVWVLASAQTAAVCALTHPDHQGKFGVFAAIDGVKFRRIVRPGDVLDMIITVDRLRGRIGRVSAEITVGGEAAVEGVLTFGLLEEPPA